MKNLEQIRAMNALAITGELKGQEGGDIVNKVPAMIRNNGLLAACAFADEKSRKAKGYGLLLQHLQNHLANTAAGALCAPREAGHGLSACLVELDAAGLRAATAESLAYLNYVRRFYKARHGEDGDE